MTLSTKKTYVIVALIWVVAGVAGALPFFFSGALPSFVDALFESVSGFSTTGATVITDIEALSAPLLMWRSLTHWLGGMGIVALTVALLPLLGVGGFSLVKAETTGPEKSKMTAKMTTTAKALWAIYAGLTLAQALLLKIFGMSTFDAISHAFSTLGTGGFSTRNASILAYNSPAIDIICTVFMALSGVNFSLYYWIFTRRFSEVRQNTELKAYSAIIVLAIVAVTVATTKFYGSIARALRFSSFQVVSVITTTGFGTADYTQWPAAAQFVIFLLFFVGGCSGSTGGGIKVVRLVVLFKCLSAQVKKLLHPHGVYDLRLNGHSADPEIVTVVISFMTLYFLLVAVTAAVGCICGMDILTSITGALSMVGNVGPAFNALSPANTCAALPSAVKLFYCFSMVAGRLELYTILIFFTKEFWTK